MKSNDLKILHHIRKNARINLTTLSRKTGIPVSTIFDRLKMHEQQFVTKFTALLDFSRLGYPVRAHVYLKIDATAREKLKHFLLEHENVNMIQRINNGYDFAVECVFVNIREVEDFVETLELQFHVLDKKVFHIIDDIAREKMMTLNC